MEGKEAVVRMYCIYKSNLENQIEWLVQIHSCRHLNIEPLSLSDTALISPQILFMSSVLHAPYPPVFLQLVS